MQPIRVGVSFETPGVATLQTADQRLENLTQRLNNLQVTSTNASRVLRTLANDMNMLANQRMDNIARGVEVLRSGMNSLFNTIDRLGRYGFYTFIGAVGASSLALKKFGSDFLSINEQFAGLEITLKSAFNSLRVAKELRNELALITMKSPLPFKDLAETTRALSVLPYPRSQIMQASLTPGGLSNENSFFARAIKLIEQMTTFRPDKTAQDAIFAVREALTGEFRSLIRRFDIPISMLTIASGKSYGELRKDPQATFEALTKGFGQIITPQAIQEVIRQPTKLFQNIKEAIYEIPQLFMGDEGFYKKFVDFFVDIFDKATNFVNTGLKPLTKRMSDTMGSIFDDIVKYLGGGLEALLDKVGMGKGAHPGMDAFQRTFMAIGDMMGNVARKLPELLDRLSGFFKNLWPMLENIGSLIVKVTDWATRGLATNPKTTIAQMIGASTLYNMLPAAMSSMLGAGFSKLFQGGRSNATYGLNAYNPTLADLGQYMVYKPALTSATGSRQAGMYIERADAYAFRNTPGVGGYLSGLFPQGTANQILAGTLTNAGAMLPAAAVAMLQQHLAARQAGRMGTAGFTESLAGNIPITNYTPTSRLGSIGRGLGSLAVGGLMAGGIGAASAGIIWGIYEAIDYFAKKTKEAADVLHDRLVGRGITYDSSKDTTLINLARLRDEGYLKDRGTTLAPMVNFERLRNPPKSGITLNSSVNDIIAYQPETIANSISDQVTDYDKFVENIIKTGEWISKLSAGIESRQKFQVDGLTFDNTPKDLAKAEEYFIALNRQYRKQKELADTLPQKFGKFDALGLEYANEFKSTDRKNLDAVFENAQNITKSLGTFFGSLEYLAPELRNASDKVASLTIDNPRLLSQIDTFTQGMEEKWNPGFLLSQYLEQANALKDRLLSATDKAAYQKTKNYDKLVDKYVEQITIMETALDAFSPVTADDLDSVTRKANQIEALYNTIEEIKSGAKGERDLSQQMLDQFEKLHYAFYTAINAGIADTFTKYTAMFSAKSTEEFQYFRDKMGASVQQLDQAAANVGINAIANYASFAETIGQQNINFENKGDFQRQTLQAMESFYGWTQNFEKDLAERMKDIQIIFTVDAGLTPQESAYLEVLAEDTSKTYQMLGNGIRDFFFSILNPARKAYADLLRTNVMQRNQGAMQVLQRTDLNPGSLAAQYAYGALDNRALGYGLTDARSMELFANSRKPSLEVLIADTLGGLPVSNKLAKIHEQLTVYKSDLEILRLRQRELQKDTPDYISTANAIMQVTNAVDQLNVQMEQLTGRQGGPLKTFGEGFTSVVDEWYYKMNDFKDIGVEMANTLKTSFGSAFTSFVTGAQSAEEAFANFGKTLIETAINMLAQQAVMQIFGGIWGQLGWAGTSAAGGMGSYSGGIATRKAAGGYVPGYGYSDNVPVLATPGEYVINKDAANQLGAANLNALNAGQIPRGGDNYNVTINVQGGAGTKEDNQQLAQQISLLVKNEIIKARRQGGILA